MSIVNNLIRVSPKKREPKTRVVQVQRPKAPELPSISRAQFRGESISLIEDYLIDQKIVVPRTCLNDLGPIVEQVGKLYYELSAPMKF